MGGCVPVEEGPEYFRAEEDGGGEEVRGAVMKNETFTVLHDPW